MRFALSTPGICGFCTPGSRALLAGVLDAAEAYTPLEPGEREAAMAAMAADELIFPLAEKAKPLPTG